MNEPYKVWWKIIVGAVIVVIQVVNLPMYLGGGTQANTGLALSILLIIGGLYLMYRGLYPIKR